MKEGEYVDLICRPFCKYYKGGKEDSRCGTFEFLRMNLTACELRHLIDYTGSDGRDHESAFSKDGEIRGLACDDCDFLVNGCDYRENRAGPPCGGYAVLELLLDCGRG